MSGPASFRPRVLIASAVVGLLSLASSIAMAQVDTGGTKWTVNQGAGGGLHLGNGQSPGFPWESTKPKAGGDAYGTAIGETTNMTRVSTPVASGVCTAENTTAAGAAASQDIGDEVTDLISQCADATRVIVKNAPGLYLRLRTPPRPPTDVVPTSQEGKMLPVDTKTAEQGGSDPVNPVNGAFVMHRTDISVPAPGVAFALSRSYSSRIDFNGPLGFGWDHNYNQRLVPTTDESCEGGLVYAMGLGGALDFEKIGETATQVRYKPTQPVHFTLLGVKRDDGALSGWEIRYPEGTVLFFDERGLLTRVEDTSHLGLDLTWETAAEPALWRVLTVTDAADRVFTFTYGTSNGRLERVSEPTSALEVRYGYAGAHGDLTSVTDAFGRKEGYDYSLPVSVPLIPERPTERQLQGACELYCAPAKDTCHSGGVCEPIIAEKQAECAAKIGECQVECGTLCQERIIDGDLNATVRSECANPSDGSTGCADRTVEFDAYCQSDAFDQVKDSVCGLVRQELTNTCFSAGDAPDERNVNCGQSCTADTANVCGVGTHCSVEFWESGTGSCVCDGSNECGGNDRCVATMPVCKWFAHGQCDGNLAAWKALAYSPFPECNGPELDDSLPASDPAWIPCREKCVEKTTLHCETDQAVGCQEGVFDGCKSVLGNTCEVAAEANCVDRCVTQTETTCEDECYRNPDWGCDPPNWYAERCADLDWAGACQDACVPECVKVGRGGETEKPWYGNPAHLGHNLIRVKDGDDHVYLVNHYGQDPRKPDFDAVYLQEMGGQTARIYYRDLVAEQQHPELKPSDDSTPLVDSLETFESLDICPQYCGNQLTFTPPGDVAAAAATTSTAEYAPWADMLLALDGESAVGGLPGDMLSAHEVALTVLSVDRVGASATHARAIHPTQFPTGLAFSVQTPQGTVSFARHQTSADTLVLAGPVAAITALVDRERLTIFSETAGNELRVYTGAPRGLVALEGGSCTDPFRVASGDDGELTFIPADACAGEFTVAPLATKLESTWATQELVEQGATAFNGLDLFEATSLVLWRQSLRLSRTGTGRYRPSINFLEGKALPVMGGRSRSAASLSTLFATPTAGEADDHPLYVFHVPWFDRPQDPGILPLYDSGNEFVAKALEAGCTAIDGVPRANAGPRPVSATVMIDGYGTPWTFYYDENGNKLRSVNGRTTKATSFNYNGFGDVTGVAPPLMDRRCITYDQAGNVTQVATFPTKDWTGNPEPHIQRFAYQQNPSRLVRVYDPGNPRAVQQSFEWNGDGFLEGSLDAMGQPTVFADFEPWGAPRTITTFDGTVTTFVYDPSTALATRVETAAGGEPIVQSMTYDAAGRPLTAVSPLGGTTRWTWSQDRTTATQSPGPFLNEITREGGDTNTTTTFTYDATGQVVSGTTDNLLQVTIQYDGFGAPRRVVTRALDGSAPDIVSCRKHGQNARLDAEVRPDGSRVLYHYDGEGRLTSVDAGRYPADPGEWDDDCAASPPATAGNAAGQISETLYDANGRSVGFKDARGLLTSLTRDRFGRPIEILDPNGNRQRIGYDTRGRVEWVAAYDLRARFLTYADPTFDDPGLLAATSFVRDSKGRVTTQARWYFDERDHHRIGTGMSFTRHEYDDQARRVRVIDDNSHAFETIFDGVGRPLQRLLPTGDSETFTYEDGGRLVTRTWTAPGGPRTQQLQSNEVGAPLSMNEVVNQAVVPLRSWSYDSQGRPSTATNEAGFSTTFGYDAFNRLTAQTTQSSLDSFETVTLKYDPLGRVLERRSAVGADDPALTTYGYDVLGRPTSVQRPEGLGDTYIYEGLSPLPKYRENPTASSSYLYDGAGRVTKIWALGAGTSDLVFRSFVYDGLGRLVEATDSGDSMGSNTDDLTTYMAWDSLSGKLEEWNTDFGQSQAITHLFDGVGSPIESMLVNQRVDRTFDSLGRQVDVRLQGASTPAVHFAYDGLGGPTQRTYANGITSTFEYDALGRLDRMTDRKGSALLADWQWGIPLDGVPRTATFTTASTVLSSRYVIDGSSRVELEDHGIGSALGGSMAFDTPSGDANDQVADMPAGRGMGASGWGSGASVSGWRLYALDGRGNWLSRISKGLAETSDLNLLDAYTRFGTQTPLYHPDGSLQALGNETYEYNAFGEVSDVTVGEETRHYRYDALGRRVQETRGGGVEVYWLFDGVRRVVRHTAVNGLPAGRDVFVDGQGLDQHLVGIDASTLDKTADSHIYYHQDRSNSVYLVTDAAGAPLERYQYTAYGEMTVLDAATGLVRPLPASGNRFGFQGQPFDSGTGLVDMRARLYRPAWGRFISPDPIGLRGGPNLYAFANSAPTAWWDPMGTDYWLFGDGGYGPHHVGDGAGVEDIIPGCFGTDVCDAPAVSPDISYENPVDEWVKSWFPEREYQEGLRTPGWDPEHPGVPARVGGHPMNDMMDMIVRQTPSAAAMTWLLFTGFMGSPGVAGVGAADALVTGAVGRAQAELGLRGAVDEFAEYLVKTLSNKQRGPVLTGVLDTTTGEVYFGLNQGAAILPEELHPLLRAGYEELTLAGGLEARAGILGSHSEIVALNKAFYAHEAATGVAMTAADLGSFSLFNRALRGSRALIGIPPLCTNCSGIVPPGVNVLPAP